MTKSIHNFVYSKNCRDHFNEQHIPFEWRGAFLQPVSFMGFLGCSCLFSFTFHAFISSLPVASFKKSFSVLFARIKLPCKFKICLLSSFCCRCCCWLMVCCVAAVANTVAVIRDAWFFYLFSAFHALPKSKCFFPHISTKIEEEEEAERRAQKTEFKSKVMWIWVEDSFFSSQCSSQCSVCIHSVRHGICNGVIT